MSEGLILVTLRMWWLGDAKPLDPAVNPTFRDDQVEPLAATAEQGERLVHG